MPFYLRIFIWKKFIRIYICLRKNIISERYNLSLVFIKYFFININFYILINSPKLNKYK